MRKLIFIISVIFVPASVYAGPGTDPSSFLSFGSGGRAFALGGAYSGIAEDAAATYYNSGALGLIQQKEMIASYSSLWLDANYSFMGYVHPLFEKGALGFSMVRLYSGLAEGRDENNMPTSSFDSAKTAVNLGYGKSLTRHFSVGMNAKFINSTLGTQSSINFFALDFGGYLKINHTISIGANLQNAIPLTMGDTDDRLPLNFRLGAGYRVFGDMLLFAFDINKNASYKGGGIVDFYSLGMEANPVKPLSLRLGKNDQEITAGFGLKFGPKRNLFSLDYAVAVHDYLGTSHRASFGWKFGRNITERVSDKIAGMETLNFTGDEEEVKRKKEDKFKELYQLASDDYRRGMFIYSLNKFQQAHELLPEDTLVKQYIERLQTVTSVIVQNVSSGETNNLLRRGVGYFIEGDGENAVKTLGYALSMEPENFTLERLLNQIQDKTGFKPEKATPTTKISVVDQKLYECLVFFKKRDYWKVVSLCEEILVLEPKNVIALKRMGSALYALNEKKMAEEVWAKALKIEPDAKLEKLLKKLKEERVKQ